MSAAFFSSDIPDSDNEEEEEIEEFVNPTTFTQTLEEEGKINSNTSVLSKEIKKNNQIEDLNEKFNRLTIENEKIEKLIKSNHEIKESEFDGDLDCHVLDLLETCNSYNSQKEGLAKSLSDAFYQLSLARKANRSIMKIDDLRQDLHPKVTIQYSQENHNYEILSLNTQSEDTLTTPPSNVMLMLCGLPPPALKKSQDNFSLALQQAIALIPTQIRLEEHCQLIETILTKNPLIQ